MVEQAEPAREPDPVQEDLAMSEERGLFPKGTEHMGDGVYAYFDELQRLVVATSNGLRITNRVFLEPEVWRELANYVKRGGLA